MRVAGSLESASPSSRVDIDRELDPSAYSGHDTELDDDAMAQAFAIGRAAVNSPAWPGLGMCPVSYPCFSAHPL